MTPLLQRIITAALLIPLVVGAVLWLPSMGFAIVLGVFALLGAYEWGRVGELSPVMHGIFVLSVALSLLAGYFFIQQTLLLPIVMTLSMLWWLLALGAVIRQQQQRPVLVFNSAAVRFVVGWLILAPCWLALFWLHQRSPALVMLVLVLIWVADIGAFFVGRRFGQRKLASHVSPGKSWEGVIGGLIAVLFFAVAANAIPAIHRQIEFWPPAVFVLLCLLVGVISVIGDLIESLFKRRAGVKDSGVLIPGHGGVLDRIDSLTAAGPCFAAGWVLVQSILESQG